MRASGVSVFTRRLVPVGIAVLAGLAIWRLSDVCVIAFGAVLLSLLLRGLAHHLGRATGLPETWAVVPVVVTLLGAFGATFWLFGSQIAAQFELLAQDLPQSTARLLRDVEATPWGAWLLGRARDVNVAGATGQAAGYLALVFGSVFRSVAYGTVLVFAGLYLAIQPARYRDAVLRLVPGPWRAHAGATLELMGVTLRRWLIGQSITMAVVGTLTAIGLAVLGIAAPLALGLIAGMFAFVPYVGPLLAAAPGVLMGAMLGPLPALYVMALYAAIHFVEGNLVTPLVQAEAVELPPVLTLFGTLVFGLLLGPIGVLLAAPITVVLLVAVNVLYIEGVLGEPRVWPARR